jgi:hypothetical protein
LISAACVRNRWTYQEFVELFACQPTSFPMPSVPYLHSTDAVAMCWSAVQWGMRIANTRFEERLKTEQINPLLDCGNGQFKQDTWRRWPNMFQPCPWRLRPARHRRPGKCFACKLTRVLNCELLTSGNTQVGQCGSVCATRIRRVLAVDRFLRTLQRATLHFTRAPNDVTWARVRSIYNDLQQHRDQVIALTTTDA